MQRQEEEEEEEESFTVGRYERPGYALLEAVGLGKLQVP